MKNQITLSLITAAILGLNGCGGSSSNEGTTETNLSSPSTETNNTVSNEDTTESNTSSPSTETSNTSSKVTLNVSDAKLGFLKENVELKFSGVVVTDEDGKKITQLSLLKDTANKIVIYVQTPKEETKDLRIVADSDQYLATGTSLLVRPTQRDYAINLKMVEEKVGKVTEGIFMNELDISAMVDATGKTTQEIFLESNPGADISTKIKIPVSTILLDKDGNPIVNATLKVTSFDPNSQKALEAYPGGLNVMADATGFDGNGTENQEVNFKTAGFVAIEIAGDNDKRVKTFSQEVEIAMQFKVGTTDGFGNVVQAGEAVPIWSYDEDSGKWTYEEDGTAQLNNDDNTLMDVIYNITHLSYYNLDWHYGNVCSANINVIDSNNLNVLNSVDYFTVDIPGANLFRTISPWGSTADGDLVLYNVPSGYQGTVVAYDVNGSVLGSVGPTDLCSGIVGTGGWTDTNYDNEVNLTINDKVACDESFEDIEIDLRQLASWTTSATDVIENNPIPSVWDNTMNWFNFTDQEPKGQKVLEIPFCACGDTLVKINNLKADNEATITLDSTVIVSQMASGQAAMKADSNGGNHEDGNLSIPAGTSGGTNHTLRVDVLNHSGLFGVAIDGTLNFLGKLGKCDDTVIVSPRQP